MERDRSITINKDFRTTLFHWQSFPENGVAIDRINTETGKYSILARSVGGQPHLLFFEGRKGKRVWMAAFRPHEIDSFVVK